MTEGQQMKITEIVSDYPITEKDNLRHIENSKEPPEDATEQQKTTTSSSADLIFVYERKLYNKDLNLRFR